MVRCEHGVFTWKTKEAGILPNECNIPASLCIATVDLIHKYLPVIRLNFLGRKGIIRKNP